VVPRSWIQVAVVQVLVVYSALMELSVAIAAVRHESERWRRRLRAHDHHTRRLRLRRQRLGLVVALRLASEHPNRADGSVVCRRLGCSSRQHCSIHHSTRTQRHRPLSAHRNESRRGAALDARKVARSCSCCSLRRRSVSALPLVQRAEVGRVLRPRRRRLRDARLLHMVAEELARPRA
jgi:hypothetical protein